MTLSDAIRDAAAQGLMLRPIAWRSNGKGFYVQGGRLWLWSRTDYRPAQLSSVSLLTGEWEVVSQSQINDEAAG